MTSTRKITAALALAGALAAAPALAATTAPSTPGTAGTSKPTSTSSPSPASSTSSPSTEAAGSKGRHGAPITLRLDSKGNIDKAALPKDSTLLTVDELRPIVPGLQSASFSDGALTLVVKGENADNRSTILVDLKRFGKKTDITKTWDAEKRAHEARSAKNPGLYAFAGAGKNGVADSFSDGTTTHVLLTNGDAAGEIWLSGIGFSSLGDDHASARRAYRDDVVPNLTRLLGDKVRAGGPAKAAEKEKSSTASSSARPSDGATTSSSSSPSTPSAGTRRP